MLDLLFSHPHLFDYFLEAGDVTLDVILIVCSLSHHCFSTFSAYVSLVLPPCSSCFLPLPFFIFILPLKATHITERCIFYAYLYQYYKPQIIYDYPPPTEKPPQQSPFTSFLKLSLSSLPPFTIMSIPPTVTHLYFSYAFNADVPEYPHSLKYIRFGACYNKVISSCFYSSSHFFLRLINQLSFFSLLFSFFLL